MLGWVVGSIEGSPHPQPFSRGRREQIRTPGATGTAVSERRGMRLPAVWLA